MVKYLHALAVDSKIVVESVPLSGQYMYIPLWGLFIFSANVVTFWEFVSFRTIYEYVNIGSLLFTPL